MEYFSNDAFDPTSNPNSIHQIQSDESHVI